jgi:predicted RNase H-like HicB family nuclease
MAHVNRFEVVLLRSDQGVAVGCPALPGCWSHGSTDDEALANIADAIQEYLAAVDE